MLKPSTKLVKFFGISEMFCRKLKTKRHKFTKYVIIMASSFSSFVCNSAHYGKIMHAGNKKYYYTTFLNFPRNEMYSHVFPL